jgi:hypothetical protein
MADTIGTAAAVVGIGGAGVAAYGGLVRRYRQTLGSRRDLSSRLNRLAAGVTADYVGSLLGPPALQRQADNFVEQVYWTKHALVGVLLDRTEAVQAFAITVTDPSFKFKTIDLTFDQLDIRLVSTSFRDVRRRSEPRGVRVTIGARRFAYAEVHYFGNPGGYQYFVLARNDAGVGKLDMSDLLSAGVLAWSDGFLEIPGSAGTPFDGTALWALRFLSRSQVNTLLVLGPDGPMDLLERWLGVDLDHVRLLRPSARERRRARRRTHKVLPAGPKPPP